MLAHNKIKKYVAFSILAIISLVCFAFAQEEPGINLYKIHQINGGNLAPGVYETEGFVISKQICPPCPRGVQCAPCAPESITISEENETLQIVPLTEKDRELVVYTQDLDRFELGSKYRFTIKFTYYQAAHRRRGVMAELVKYKSLGEENNQ